MSRESRLVKSMTVERVQPIGGMILPNTSNMRHKAETKDLVLIDTVYDDQQVVLGQVRLGSSSPTWTDYKGSQVLSFADNQSNKIFFTAQLSHKYKEGTDVTFHIHTIPSDDSAGAVKWDVTVSWANINEEFPAETSFSATQDIAASSGDTQLIAGFNNPLDGTGKKISSVLLCSLTRDGTDASDDYAAPIYVAALDFHFEIDRMGSREEYSK